MAKKRISDFLQGGFAGVSAGTGVLGGLGSAGLVTGAAVSPWAWGLMGGGAALGGISSLLSDDDSDSLESESMGLSNQLMEEKLADSQEARQMRKREEMKRRQFSTTLGSMFQGAKLAGPRMASGGLA